MKQIISELLQKALKKEKIDISEKEIEKLIEIPKSTELGDYAFPCFFLASKLKQDPKEIALEIREDLKNSKKRFEDIQTQGAYINFFVNKKNLTENLIKEISEKKSEYGKNKLLKKIRTMIEFPSPNTNKPLHLGHLRNMAIGESVSRISEFNGEKIIRTNLNNDRGVHICKSMLAYKKYGKNKKPSKKIKSDKFVGDFYVLFNKKVKKNKKLELEAHELLRKWEQGDQETVDLWKKMNVWAIKGFEQTYKKFGIKFDKEYFESEMFEKGKKIISKGVKEKIFKKSNLDESVTINLEKEKLGKKFLIRPDGTTIYITQDIYLAILKKQEFNLDKSIYVVANEQEYHFKVLFTILEKLGFKSKNLIHLSYGLVNLPEGRMKSREGTIVDADDLIEKIQNLVKKELNSREKLLKEELEKRSLVIALSSIKYFLLKVDIKKNMVFNPKESINFEGDTGPYLLYSYARASSILRKVKTKQKEFEIKELEKIEWELVKKISQFKNVVINSYKNLNPALIANYSYQLSQIFNEFYHACPVMNSEKQTFRLKLVESFRQVLKNSLELLGIETLEKM